MKAKKQARNQQHPMRLARNRLMHLRAQVAELVPWRERALLYAMLDNIEVSLEYYLGLEPTDDVMLDTRKNVEYYIHQIEQERHETTDTTAKVTPDSTRDNETVH